MAQFTLLGRQRRPFQPANSTIKYLSMVGKTLAIGAITAVLLATKRVNGQISGSNVTCPNGDTVIQFGLSGSKTCNGRDLGGRGFFLDRAGGGSTAFFIRCCPQSSFVPSNACGGGSWPAFCSASEPMMYFFEDICPNGFMEFTVNPGFRGIHFRGGDVNRNLQSCSSPLAGIELNNVRVWTQTEGCNTCYHNVEFAVNPGDVVRFVEGSVFAVASITLLVDAPAQTSSSLSCTAPPLCRTTSPTSQPTFRPTASPTAPPSAAPTGAPTRIPTGLPSAAPTQAPTTSPTKVIVGGDASSDLASHDWLLIGGFLGLVAAIVLCTAIWVWCRRAQNKRQDNSSEGTESVPIQSGSLQLDPDGYVAVAQ
eukprot:m.130495 g.130495  ORF g.130495 m.130495 type:complete len:366 (-) comp13714_c0_seq1:1370-2467(-)